MANVIISPNMSLPVPVPGVDPGPDYANNLNQSLNIVDGHTHAPGSGVQVTPLGLNINTDLSFQNHDATTIAGVTFSAPAPSSTTTRLYTNAQSGGGITDLFFNDGAGTVIPITKGGIVNSVASSIPGESYGGGTFTWVQGAGSTTPANFDIGSVTIRPNTAMTTNGVVLSPPAAIASQYTLALPPLPSSQKIMTLDDSGNITAPYVVDNSTIVISSNIIQVPDGGITLAKLAIAIQQALTQSGVIQAYGGTSAPSGYLICDGSSHLRATYPALFTAIGTAYGTADGTHFNVPDFRGIFPRGTDNGAGNDPDASARTAANTGGNTGDNVGSTQDFATQNHQHAQTGYINPGSPNVAGMLRSAAQFVGNDLANSGILTATMAATGGILPSTETRPINTYVNFIIKT